MRVSKFTCLLLMALPRSLPCWGRPASRDLKTQLLALIYRYNPTAKPFAWTYPGKPLHASTETTGH